MAQQPQPLLCKMQMPQETRISSLNTKLMMVIGSKKILINKLQKMQRRRLQLTFLMGQQLPGGINHLLHQETSQQGHIQR